MAGGRRPLTQTPDKARGEQACDRGAYVEEVESSTKKHSGNSLLKLRDGFKDVSFTRGIFLGAAWNCEIPGYLHTSSVKNDLEDLGMHSSVSTEQLLSIINKSNHHVVPASSVVFISCGAHFRVGCGCHTYPCQKHQCGTALP